MTKLIELREWAMQRYNMAIDRATRNIWQEVIDKINDMSRGIPPTDKVKCLSCEWVGIINYTEKGKCPRCGGNVK